MSNQKGFVGPIGDDLPSIIPLSVALLVFFGAFGFAFTQFEEKKAEFDQRLLLLGVGRTLKGDSFIDSFEKWKNACNALEVTRYRFRAVVYRVSTNPAIPFVSYEFFHDLQDPLNPDGSVLVNGDSIIFVMTNAQNAGQRLACDNITETDLYDPAIALKEISSVVGRSQKTLRVNFPVAVYDANTAVPAILTVMVWKN